MCYIHVVVINLKRHIHNKSVKYKIRAMIGKAALGILIILAKTLVPKACGSTAIVVLKLALGHSVLAVFHHAMPTHLFYAL